MISASNDQNKPRRIESLQALRALAFLGIFLCHVDAPIEWASLSVSIFFVLSGFLLFYQYENKALPDTFRGCLSFSWKKISRLYPLHLLTLCSGLIYTILIRSVLGWDLKNYVYILLSFFLNIPLLQSWFPYLTVNVSLNGVAWYLSVMLFLYLIFPFIKTRIKKMSVSTACISCIVILFIEIFSCIPWIRLLGNDHPSYIWFTYCFPVFRAGDFWAGCCLAKYFQTHPDQNSSFLLSSIKEGLTLVLCILVYLLLKHIPPTILGLAIANTTTMYIPLAVLCVAVFVRKAGLFTKLLCNPALELLGNLSAYTFLIHYVVINWISYILEHFQNTTTAFCKTCIILFEFALSILLSALYKNRGGSLLR